jgi:hypothetical protein
MELKQAENDYAWAPSKWVDEMWHAHILATKEYHDFCERFFHGVFVHHNPMMPIRHPLQFVPEGIDRYGATLVEYENVFGIPPDPTIWTPNQQDDDDDHGESSSRRRKIESGEAYKECHGSGEFYAHEYDSHCGCGGACRKRMADLFAAARSGYGPKEITSSNDADSDTDSELFVIRF